MKEQQFDVFMMLCRFLATRIVQFLLPGQAVLKEMYPQLYVLLDPEHWFRCLVSEGLAVMTNDDHTVRANRGPWALVKILRSTEDEAKEAVKFIFKHLFIWVPAHVAVYVVHVHVRGEATSRLNDLKYRVEKSDEADGGGFSFLVHRIRMPSVALARLQSHFPAVGHLFRIGAVHPTLTDKLTRIVDLQFNTELPIFKPALREYVGSRLPQEHMPRVWAVDGTEATLIHSQLMGQSEQQFYDECKNIYYQNPPLLVKNADHNGFGFLTRRDPFVVCEDPADLWDSDMDETFELKRPKRRRKIEQDDLAAALANASRETVEPSPRNEQ